MKTTETLAAYKRRIALAGAVGRWRNVPASDRSRIMRKVRAGGRPQARVVRGSDGSWRVERAGRATNVYDSRDAARAAVRGCK